MADFLPERSEGKKVNAAEAKPKQSIGVCVASVVTYTNLPEAKRWLESLRPKKLFWL